MRDYPRWMYHEKGAERIIESAEEEAALPEGWSDYPTPRAQLEEALEPEAALEAIADHDEPEVVQ